MTLHYPSLPACRDILFPMIRLEMSQFEPSPQYENERRGLDKLDSIFSLMQRDSYYPDFFSKASYLFCAIIDGHPFSNGNKRAAVATLSYFLVVNGHVLSSQSMDAVREALHDQFPHLQWQHVKSFHFPHEYFFYHLALIIADRNQKGKMTFRQEQMAVVELLRFITASL